MNHASPALGIPLMGPDPRRFTPSWLHEKLLAASVYTNSYALKQIIERDIAEFNKLESINREGRKFELHANDEGTMPILRVEQMGGSSGPSLGIEMSASKIRSRRQSARPLTQLGGWS